MHDDERNRQIDDEQWQSFKGSLLAVFVLLALGGSGLIWWGSRLHHQNETTLGAQLRQMEAVPVLSTKELEES
jgi:hypothetical protein